MKRRLILINSLILVIALFFSLAYNVGSFNDFNGKNAKSELSNYLKIVENIYEEGNEEVAVNLFDGSNKNIRVTIISLDGTVIADSSTEDISTNHLLRDEIKNLGTFAKRKSVTLGKDMLYLASLDDGAYVRVALEVKQISNYVITYLITDGITTLILLLIGIAGLIIVIRQYLQPLQEATKKLELMTKTNNDIKKKDSLEVYVKTINDASEIILSQMDSLKEEKDKIYYIINNISQGLIILDSANNVELINDHALKILSLEMHDVLNKNYIYCFRDSATNEAINNVIQLKSSQSVDLSLDGYTYQVYISKFDESIAILIADVTRLKKLDLIKREFFQNASHELKSPLTSIIGYQQMIKEGILTDEEEIKDATIKTIKEANRMNDIIIEMLEISKLENITEKEVEDINVADIVHEVISCYENRMFAKNISLIKEIDKVNVLGNREHLYSLIKNLVDNAVKYNKENGKIIIRLRGDKFMIEDTGIGIEEKNIAMIFERFYSVDKAKSKALGSTGLGLSIVKHICKMYAYKVEVKSTFGEGTSVTIFFK